MLPQKPVGTDHVADVNEVADYVEVANLQTLALASFYLSHMERQPGQHIAGRLTRPRVVERPNHDGVGPVRKIMLDAQQVGCGLACGVGVVRP